MNKKTSTITDTEKKEYMYYNLVKNKDDIVGMIAYCQYKAAKIQHIEKEKKLKGIKPTDEDLKAFQKTQITDATIEAYKKSALSLLETFQAIEFKEKTEEFNKRGKKLQREEKKIKKIADSCPAKKQLNFWLSVLASAVSTILLSLVFLILWVSEFLPSLIEIISNSLKS